MEALDRPGWTVTVEISIGYFRFTAKNHITGYTLTHSARFTDSLDGACEKVSKGMIAFEQFQSSNNLDAA